MKKSKKSKSIDISSTFSEGWKVMRANLLPLLVIALITAIINGIGSSGDESAGTSIFSTLWSIFLVGPVGMSAAWVYLKAVRKKKFVISDMFSVFKRNYWNAVIAGILTAVFVVIGLILLIVPGIIIACRLTFVSYLIIDKKMEALQAIKKSWEMTRGHAWKIFLMILLSILIVIAGLIVLVVGVLFSFAWISSTWALLYHKFSK